MGFGCSIEAYYAWFDQPQSENLGKYLGMPLLHSRITKATYGGLVDKVHGRLASWKASEKRHKVHLCQWDLVCRPKAKVGWGLKKSHNMNQGLLAKWGGGCSEGHSLCAKIFEAKYLKGQSILDSKLASRQGSSSTWKGVLFGAELLNKGLIWRLGKGDRVNFWKDTWIGDFPLMQRVDSIEGVDVDCPISHFFKHGWWDVDKLRNFLAEDTVHKIISLAADFDGRLEDIRIWKYTDNRSFTVKSAYNLLFKGSDWPDSWWKGKILSNEQRREKTPYLDSSCQCCGKGMLLQIAWLIGVLIWIWGCFFDEAPAWISSILIDDLLGL
ncbi:Polynucleotidyl transferase, ribonuclease H-like superfamily protein [Prunus dulcis]|uniref:Polynucleotidyl transferase, ribonuclease H-like superfamily protein n=1 Tax=Prunus dulcis TaxID=3755 RepID=A0A4Y1RM06_PRUDU|nr:Polynucleotidyl transferase, ribonuclease H-like superfamily protein [Prunus dulcis]